MLGHSKRTRGSVLERSTSAQPHNESLLEGFVDEADEAVYAAAVKVFRRNLRRYVRRGVK